MAKKYRMSMQTRINWLIDAGVFTSALLAILSGIYFLFLPDGGYRGGRNATYGITVLFSRSTWDDLHTWGGVLMISAVLVHFTYHWPWVVRTATSLKQRLIGTKSRMSKGAVLNISVDALMAVAFLITAISGIYFLFAPTGGSQGGTNAGWDPGFLFSRTTWDLIHTWSGVTMIAAAVIHFTIHWKWVTKVTRRFFGWLLEGRMGRGLATN
jgi:cytochrome b subunit of formate dehydrogenase